MSNASDKKTVAAEIQYLERAISGLAYTVASSEIRAAEVDAEVSALLAKRARILSDAEKAPALLSAMRAQLSALRALDFLSAREVREKNPKGSVADLRRQLLAIKRKLDSLGVTPDQLAIFSAANPTDRPS